MQAIFLNGYNNESSQAWPWHSVTQLSCCLLAPELHVPSRKTPGARPWLLPGAGVPTTLTRVKGNTDPHQRTVPRPQALSMRCWVMDTRQAPGEYSTKLISIYLAHFPSPIIFPIAFFCLWCFVFPTIMFLFSNTNLPTCPLKLLFLSNAQHFLCPEFCFSKALFARQWNPLSFFCPSFSFSSLFFVVS